MKTEYLRKWLKASGTSREELAKMCRVSKRTVDGWFAREDLPEPAGVYIQHIISGNIKFCFTLSEIHQLLRKMETQGCEDICTFLTDLVKEHISKPEMEMPLENAAAEALFKTQ